MTLQWYLYNYTTTASTGQLQGDTRTHQGYNTSCIVLLLTPLNAYIHIAIITYVPCISEDPS